MYVTESLQDQLMYNVLLMKGHIIESNQNKKLYIECKSIIIPMG